MSVFAHIPLGQRIPASLHGVSCSLPTMRDIIGYEEKNPETLRHLTSGYPRFVQHPFLRQAALHIVRALGLDGHAAWLTSSRRAAEALAAHLRPAPARVIAHDGLHGVAFPDNANTHAAAKTFLQHTGMLLSSREAEDYLLRAGEIPSAQRETTRTGDTAAHIRTAVARAFGGGATPDDVFLTSTGMNACYAAFRVASALQQPRGRTVWIQLGWLYLDTIALLQKFTPNPARDHVYLRDVFDLAALRRLFAERGHEIAGVITETPTNPLIQTPDLAAVAALCRAHDALFIADPSVVSPLNIDILPHCDVAVTSLTKYAASEGDIIMGAAVVNPQSPHAADFRSRLPAETEPVYARDLDRMAHEITGYAAVVARINQNTAEVIAHLEKHPGVKSLHWSLHPGSRENYLKLARSPASIGSMFSLTVHRPLAEFYDRLRLPKGPSFGMKTTLVSPFIYLAHYDLVTHAAGRETLRASGIDPELVRISIGCEPVADILAALDEALA